MTEIEVALQKLAVLQGKVTSDIINDLITDAKDRHDEMADLYKRYKADDSTVPVFLRTFDDTNKINRTLNNSFDSEIVDTKVGYMFGRPVVYSMDKTEYQDEAGNWTDKAGYDRQQKVLDDFAALNMLDDLDSETGKMASICGMGARLCYIDKAGKARVMEVPPWECIWIYDRSINEPAYALRYYNVQMQDGDTWQTRTRVEWYDASTVTFYISGDKGQYGLDESEQKWDPANEEYVPDNPKRHLFDTIPLIPFPNNGEAQGDSEKVLSLVDGYDRTVSDMNSELEQFRLAYMKFIGTTVDADTVKMAQKTGAFGLPADSDVSFITKEINDAVIENHLNRLEQNILRFAKHVNFGDDAFAGNQSGVALKFKLFGLESKCIALELKFKKALLQQWQCVASAWQRAGIDIDPLNIFAEFSRNFPLNLLEEAQTSLALKGLVSEPTRLALLSFVDDPAYELQLMKQEQEEALAVQQEMFEQQPQSEGEEPPIE